MLHPSATLGSESLKTLLPATVANRGTLFEPHNPAAVSVFEHAVGGIVTRADPSAPSPLFAGKCSDDGLPTWESYMVGRTPSTSTFLGLRDLPAFAALGGIRPVSRRRSPREMNALMFE
jgi:hypothetical protein